MTPDPDPSPHLFYDGSCPLCLSLASRTQRFALCPVQLVDTTQLDDDQLNSFGLSRQQTDTALWWIDGEGGRHRGHRAVAALLVTAGGWRRMLGRALSIPPLSWVAGSLYAWVARHRRRLGRLTRASGG